MAYGVLGGAVGMVYILRRCFLGWVVRVARKQVTSRFRTRESLFARKIVITIPPWGVGVLAGVIILGMTRYPYFLLSCIALITTTIALGVILEARHQLRTFRHEYQEKLISRPELWDIPDGDYSEGWLPNLPDKLTDEKGEGESGSAERRIRLSE